MDCVSDVTSNQYLWPAGTEWAMADDDRLEADFINCWAVILCTESWEVLPGSAVQLHLHSCCKRTYIQFICVDVEAKQVSVASSPAGQSNSMASAAAIDRYKLQIEELEKKLADVSVAFHITLLVYIFLSKLKS